MSVLFKLFDMRMVFFVLTSKYKCFYVPNDKLLQL